MQILQLLNLRYLNLSYQGLVHIPDSISLLSSLQHLVVSYNPHLLNIAAEAGSLPLMCKWYQDDQSAPVMFLILAQIFQLQLGEILWT